MLAPKVKHHRSHHHSDLAKELIDNFCVENLLLIPPTLEQYREYVLGARGILIDMAMNIREFASNSRDTLQGLARALRQNADSVKVLGLKWEVSNDTLQI